MEETSLKITGANKGFINRLTNTISRILIPTKVGLNGMIITVKRNLLIKSYEHYISEEDKELYEKKYEEAYEAYLETLDKYVMDSIYKKVKNNTASDFEKNALSKYYGVISLKENEYVEYKFRKQKFLIELDKENVQVSNKEKIILKYEKFYVQKMDWIYKGILKNYSIKLADTIQKYDSTKEWIYMKIFNTLKEYIEKILPLKLKDTKLKDIEKQYAKYEAFEVGKLDQRDVIEKNMLLLEISRGLFTHSLPLAVAEQCYMKLLKDARSLVQDTKIAIRREKAYATLITLMEEYNVKLLSTKVYWDNMEQRDKFKEFWKKYQELAKYKELDFVEYTKRKEVLFIKDDIKKINTEKFDYSKLIKYYKRKLVDYGVMKQIQGFKTEKYFTKK